MKLVTKVPIEYEIGSWEQVSQAILRDLVGFLGASELTPEHLETIRWLMASVAEDCSSQVLINLQWLAKQLERGFTVEVLW